MWKKIIVDENETNYSISETGEVKNDVSGRLLNPSIQQGYCHVGLTIDGKIRRFRVHRLVAIAFIENPENKPYVNHIDGCRSNNSVENLEWCTPAENTQHAVKTGLMSPTREKRVIQYSLNGEKIQEFISLSEAARQTGSQGAKITLCCQFQRKTHNGFQWRYKEDEQDSIQKVNESPTKKKAVAQINPKTNEVIATYESIADAARAVNGTSSAIIHVIKGDKQTKTHKGFGWKLVEDIVQ
jgi:hypothetical protein